VTLLGVAAAVAFSVGGCDGPIKQQLAHDAVAKSVAECEMEATRVAVDTNTLDADQEPNYIATCMHAKGYDLRLDLPDCKKESLPQATTACYVLISR
jgi:hypothetical protein